MARLRLARLLFLIGFPFAIGFHVLMSRSTDPLVRGTGLFLALAWLLFFTYLTYVRCPRCQRSFYGRFAGQVFGPWAAFRARPTCAQCGSIQIGDDQARSETGARQSSSDELRKSP